MKHKEVQKKLDLYIEGELSSAESKKIREHLKVCDICRKEYEKYLSLFKLTGKLRNYRITVPQNLAHNIISNLEDNKNHKFPFPFTYKYLAPVIALATIIFFLLPVQIVQTPDVSIYYKASLNSGRGTEQSASNNINREEKTINRGLNSMVDLADYGNGQKVRDYDYQPKILYRKTPTYIVPIVSAKSWDKLTGILAEHANDSYINIKPIITDPEVDTVELEEYLKSLNFNNVAIDDPIYSTDELPYPNNKGILLQVTVKK